jgi:hypothetical protein
MSNPEQSTPADPTDKPAKKPMTKEQAQLRFALVTIPPIIIVLLLGFNVFREIQSAPPWREELSEFLSTVYGVGDIEDVLTGSAQAQSPGNLGETAPIHAVGQSAYWRTDAPLPGQAPTEASTLPPLPYPPVELWCFRVDPAVMDNGTLFLAHHREGDQSDWLLHLPHPDSDPAAIEALLAEVGCEFRTRGSE